MHAFQTAFIYFIQNKNMSENLLSLCVSYIVFLIFLIMQSINFRENLQ